VATPLANGMILSVGVWCVDGNQASVNTFHYLCSAVGAAPATDVDMAQNIDVIVAPLMKVILNNNASYRGVMVQKLRPLPIAIDVVTNANAGAGSAGAIALPKQSAGLTSWYTAVAGRKGRGRTYWPFPSSTSDAGDGTPTNTYTGNLSALGTALSGFTSISLGGRTATVGFGLYHRALGTFDPIVSTIIRGVWATQRKRGSYGRGNSAPM
jgi:hypothetical protein